MFIEYGIGRLLRERAAHYRRLAAESGTLRQHFEELAQQYDKLAEAMEADERNQPEGNSALAPGLSLALIGHGERPASRTVSRA